MSEISDGVCWCLRHPRWALLRLVRFLLSDALRDVPPELKLFVKIDAEGADRRIVASSLDFLRRRKTKVACCTYHRQDDADALAQMFEKAGFRTSFSDGWMLLPMNGIRHPYFRRGVIRAVNYGED